MDARHGTIYKNLKQEDLKDMERKLHRPLIPITEDDARLMSAMGNGRRKNYMRNKPCVCGSGVKFKRCCWSKFS